MDSIDELERRRAGYLTNAAEAQTRSLKTGDAEARDDWQQIELGWLNMAETTRLRIARLRRNGE